MSIKLAQNVHRTYVLNQINSNNMDQDQISDIIDFKEMALGSFHARWTGNDAITGQLIYEASCIPEDPWFEPVECAEVTMDEDGSGPGNKKTKLFNLHYIGYRYGRIRYLKGDNTMGILQIVAMGKKGG